jgi:hypothetical protein
MKRIGLFASLVLAVAACSSDGSSVEVPVGEAPTANTAAPKAATPEALLVRIRQSLKQIEADVALLAQQSGDAGPKAFQSECNAATSVFSFQCADLGAENLPHVAHAMDCAAKKAKLQCEAGGFADKCQGPSYQFRSGAANPAATGQFPCRVRALFRR